MKELLNKVNTYTNKNFVSLAEFINDYNDLIDKSNNLVMFISSKEKEKIKMIQDHLKNKNFIILGNINCPIEEYENDIEDDGFELELGFNGKYEFKAEEIGYDAITKLFFFYFYPLNDNIKNFSDFYNNVFYEFIDDNSINYLLIDDFGYINTVEESKPLNIEVSVDFSSKEQLVNSIYLLSLIKNNSLYNIDIKYINE